MIYDLQKADTWKRISATIFDIIIMFILFVGISFGLSAALNYDEPFDRLNAAYEEYSKDTGLSVEVLMLGDDSELTDAQKVLLDETIQRIEKDVEIGNSLYVMVNLTLIIVSVGFLLTFIILEFLVPVILGNGQTMGKKIFGIGVMRYDGVKVSNLLLFVRAILGKCTVVWLVPAFSLILTLFGGAGIFGLILILVIYGTQLGLFLFSRDRTTIHDLIAQTVTVDLASQMIFETPEALLEYKQKMQAEKASKANY